MHHSSNPDYIIIHDLLRDGYPGDVTLAAEVHVATKVVFDVLHPEKFSALTLIPWRQILPVPVKRSTGRTMTMVV